MRSPAINEAISGLPGFYLAAPSYLPARLCDNMAELGVADGSFVGRPNVISTNTMKGCGSLRSIARPASSDADVRFPDGKPLRVFLTSDYPLALDEGESTSGSAERIQETATELQRRGHNVVVIAPSYKDRPKKSNHPPFPIRTMLFRQYGKSRPPGVPFLDFDIPLLGSNSHLSSSLLFSQMGDVQFDRLMMGYMAMMRLTSIIFGEPDVVVSSHVTSPWNFAASNYPLLAFVSSSDMISKGMPYRLRGIMVQGAKRVFGHFTTSWDGDRRLIDLGLKLKADPQYEIPCDFDVSLVQNAESTTKAEMQERFPQLKEGISEKNRWVVLYDKSNDPHVLRYFIRVASEIERMDKEENTACIIVGKYDPKLAMRLMDERTLKRTHQITHEKKWEVQRLIGASESAVIFDVSGELPMMDKQPMQRDLWITSQLAVVSERHAGEVPTIYLPGRVDQTSSDFLSDVESEVQEEAVDFDEEFRDAVISHLRAMRESESWKQEIVSSRRVKRDQAERHALRKVLYAVRGMLIKRIVNLAAGKGVDQGVMSLQPMTEPGSSAVGSKPERVRWRFMDLVERSLYIAVNGGKRIPAALTYQPHAHAKSRRQRLAQVEFDPYLRDAFNDMIRDMRDGWCPASAYRRWESVLLRKLYTSKFAKPAIRRAMPDPRRNPNGVLSEVARLTGVPTPTLFKYLAQIEEIDPRELVSPADSEVASVEPQNVVYLHERGSDGDYNSK